MGKREGRGVGRSQWAVLQNPKILGAQIKRHFLQVPPWQTRSHFQTEPRKSNISIMPNFDFLIDFSEEEIIALCGCSSDVLHQLYDKYCGPDTPIRRPIYLWWLFQFYKMYPVSRGFRSIHMGRLSSRRCFMMRMYKWEVTDPQRWHRYSSILSWSMTMRSLIPLTWCIMMYHDVSWCIVLYRLL